MTGITVLSTVVGLALVCQAFVVPPPQTETIYFGRYPHVTYIHRANSSYIVEHDSQNDYAQDRKEIDSFVQFRSSNSPLQFTVKFISFRIPYDQRCREGSLCVKGVKFCGSWEDGRSFTYVVPAYQTFTLAFLFSAARSLLSVKLKVDIQAVDNNHFVSEPSAGVGSTFRGLVFRPSYPIQNYADSCSKDSSPIYIPVYLLGSSDDGYESWRNSRNKDSGTGEKQNTAGN